MKKTYEDLTKAIDARVTMLGLDDVEWSPEKPYTDKYTRIAGLTKFDADDAEMPQEVIDSMLWCISKGAAFPLKKSAPAPEPPVSHPESHEEISVMKVSEPVKNEPKKVAAAPHTKLKDEKPVHSEAVIKSKKDEEDDLLKILNK